MLAKASLSETEPKKNFYLIRFCERSSPDEKPNRALSLTRAVSETLRGYSANSYEVE